MFNIKQREEIAIVLDFLPNGYASESRSGQMRTPIAQAIGKHNFALFELVPKKGIFLQPYEEVYIGDAKRDKVHHVNGKISITKLTMTAKSEVEHAIKQLIKDNEEQFVEFFNMAQPLSTRMHSLELLPGLGKKHMWEIIDERKGDPFKSFEDLKARVRLMPDPEKIIMKRILKELEGTEKYRIFVH